MAGTWVIDSYQCDAGWHVGETGILFFGLRDEKGRSELRLREFATDKTRKILVLDRQLTGLAASPDGLQFSMGKRNSAAT
jgi:hypothetical protein